MCETLDLFLFPLNTRYQTFSKLDARWWMTEEGRPLLERRTRLQLVEWQKEVHLDLFKPVSPSHLSLKVNSPLYTTLRLQTQTS